MRQGTLTPNGRLSHEVAERNIEWVGECLDGDQCPRYRCRECGSYWLGSPAHKCRRVVPDLEQRICGWMEEEVQTCADLPTSTRRLLQRVKSEGLSDGLPEWAISELWRRHHPGDDTHNHGDANGAAKTSAGAAVVIAHQPRSEKRQRHIAWKDVPARREERTATHGIRRVDVKQLGSGYALLECLFKVEGAWIRLGDLNKRQ